MRVFYFLIRAERKATGSVVRLEVEIEARSGRRAIDYVSSQLGESLGPGWEVFGMSTSRQDFDLRANLRRQEEIRWEKLMSRGK